MTIINNMMSFSILVMKNSAIFFAFNNLASLSPPSPNNPRDESTATMLQSILISDKIKSTALKEGDSVLNTMILVKPSSHHTGKIDMLNLSWKQSVAINPYLQ